MKKAILQKAIDLLFSHSEGDFVSKAESKDPLINELESLQNENKLLIEKYNFCRDEQEESRMEYTNNITPLIEALENAKIFILNNCQHLKDSTYEKDLDQEIEFIETALLYAKS